MNLHRRNFLSHAGAAGALALMPGGALAQGKPDRITVTSYGGIWERAIRDIFVADFTKRTGVAADVQLGNPNQWLSQVEASPDKPPLHALVATPELAIEAGRKGLVEKIDGSKLKNLKDVSPRFVDICNGKPVANPADGNVGARAVEVLDAMYRSAASRRPEAV